MKYLYFTLILLLSVTFIKAQSGLELLEGTYISYEGDGLKIREIMKKGDGFIETVSFEDEEDYSNASLSERLGRYKAFQENPQLVDFLHRVDLDNNFNPAWEP